jgi:pimeloyl-ACP methyl ester carboxylesterase
VPAVVLHGTGDDVVPIALSRAYAAQTQVDLIELEGVDHFEVIEPGSAAWPAVLDAFALISGRRAH